MEIHVDTRELIDQLKVMMRRGHNLTDVNMQLAQILHVMVEDEFENNGPGGGKWKAFAESTLRRRRRSATPMLLQDTGDMVNSLQPDAGPDFAELFTNKEYARFHLEGDGVPKRDFFDIDVDKALETFGQILAEEIGRGR